MADGFQVIGTRPGTAFLGGTTTQAVVIVECQTLPDLVYFEANTPQQGFTAALGEAVAQGYAEIINTIIGFSNVTNVQWSQGPGKSQELQDMLTVTVSSTSGNSTAELPPVTIASLGPQLDKTAIDSLNSELDTLEGA